MSGAIRSKPFKRPSISKVEQERKQATPNKQAPKPKSK